MYLVHRCCQCGNRSALAIPTGKDELEPEYICMVCYYKNGKSFTPPEEPKH